MSDKDLANTRVDALRTLMSFKTKACTEENCAYQSPTIFITNTICHKFHGPHDQRRFPFVQTTENFDRYTFLVSRVKADPHFTLSDLFAELNESFKGENLGQLQLSYNQFYNGVLKFDGNCKNILEFNYHPLNYKRQPCRYKDDCKDKYCYQYHSEIERIEFIELGKAFLEPEGLFTNLKLNNQNIKESYEKFEAWQRNLTAKITNDKEHKDADRAEGIDDEAAMYEDEQKYEEQKLEKREISEEFDSSSDEQSFMMKKRGRSQDFQEKTTTTYKHVTNFLKTIGTKKKKVIKVGRHYCRPNWNKSAKFVYDKEVEVFESIHDEFKHFSKLDLRTCLNYICGFLNSYGGTLYFGINDEGIVKGVVLGRKEIDEFQINLDITLRNFVPKIFPDQVAVSYHEVCYDDQAKLVIVNRYVIQIDVFCKHSNEFYITHEHQFFIKKYGSLNNLSMEEVIAFIKSRYHPLISQEQLMDRINPLIFDRMSKKELLKIKNNLMDIVNFINLKI